MEKANEFAKHFTKVFEPNLRTIPEEEENEFVNNVTKESQSKTQISNVSISEV